MPLQCHELVRVGILASVSGHYIRNLPPGRSWNASTSACSTAFDRGGGDVTEGARNGEGREVGESK